MAVAPHAGARIETATRSLPTDAHTVAPHAGARIETVLHRRSVAQPTSLPMRERELKLCVDLDPQQSLSVAPHAGARIETSSDAVMGLS